MGFFDKVIQTSQDLGKKTKSTVEQNRLRMQISDKQKKIESNKLNIGEAIFSRFSLGKEVPEEIVLFCQQISSLQNEISEINKKIRLLAGEIECPSCGEIVKEGVKFCPSCGYKLDELTDEISKPSNEKEESSLLCEHCQSPLSESEKFCGECGQPNPLYKGV